MIQRFIDIFINNKDYLREILQKGHPEDYKSLVYILVKLLNEKSKDSDFAETPDPKRITVIDDGSCAGTLIFIIGDAGYQPENYWSMKVDYGSCSACDTLESIRMYEDGKPRDDKQVEEYLTLMLHLVQSMKEI